MKAKVKKLIRKSNKRVAFKSILYTLLVSGAISITALNVVFSRLTHMTDMYIEYQKESTNKEIAYVQALDSVSMAYDWLYSNLDNLHELNWDNVDFWLNYYDVFNVSSVKSQIFVETGNLKSNICLNSHNLVGMHYPVNRETMAKKWVRGDGGAKVSKYDFWWKSLKDYAIWQEHFGYDFEVTSMEYFTTLEDHGYAESSRYKRTLSYVHDNIITKGNI